MRQLVILIGLYLGLYSVQTLGCASCGSGGEDPLILYPNEIDKIYVSMIKSSNFQNITRDGRHVSSGGVDEKQVLNLSYGHNFDPRFFATLNTSLIRNRKGHDSSTGWGDPQLSGRYTAVIPDLTAPLIPQIQLIGSYRQAVAPSIRSTKHPKTLLDVRGTGFNEVRIGVDIWWGQEKFKLGLAEVLTYAVARTYEDINYQPGLGLRGTLTAGYQWHTLGKMLIGVNQEYKSPLTAEGEDVADSEQQNFSWFITQDWKLEDISSMRLTYSKLAAFGQNKNTAAMTSLSLAYFRQINP